MFVSLPRVGLPGCLIPGFPHVPLVIVLSRPFFLRTGMLLKRMKETAMTRMFRDVGMRCRKDVMAKMDQTSSVACELSFEN